MPSGGLFRHAGHYAAPGQNDQLEQAHFPKIGSLTGRARAERIQAGGINAGRLYDAADVLGCDRAGAWQDCRHPVPDLAAGPAKTVQAGNGVNQPVLAHERGCKADRRQNWTG